MSHLFYLTISHAACQLPCKMMIMIKDILCMNLIKIQMQYKNILNHILYLKRGMGRG